MGCSRCSSSHTAQAAAQGRASPPLLCASSTTPCLTLRLTSPSPPPLFPFVCVLCVGVLAETHTSPQGRPQALTPHATPLPHTPFVVGSVHACERPASAVHSQPRLAQQVCNRILSVWVHVSCARKAGLCLFFPLCVSCLAQAGKQSAAVPSLPPSFPTHCVPA